MPDNENLRGAKAQKKDEFYTSYKDIENEMNSYYEYNKDVFKGKTILCPCDDPEWSEFTRYFATNFDFLGLKKLICTSYAKSVGNQQITLFEQESPNYDKEKHSTHGKLFILDRSSNNSKKIDLNDIEFSYLKGDGDFRSDEVRKLRDEADMIITNPPFSLFRDFLTWINESDKEFSIIGNMNAISYKEVFPLIKDNKIWLGNGFKSMVGYFTSPYEDTASASNHKEGYIRVSGVTWFTNIDHGLRHKPIILSTMNDNLRYNKKLIKKFKELHGKIEYPYYDNYDAIEVPYSDAIPNDYNGVMGVPITFLDKYNPDEFEIIGDLVMGSATKNTSIKNPYDFAVPYVNGKKIYARILIRRKDVK